MTASITLTLTPRNTAMIISSYLLPATIERNPEPSYAENDGAGVEEDPPNNFHTHPIALSVKAQKKWLEWFFNSATQQR